jgi:hypothetical protein
MAGGSGKGVSAMAGLKAIVSRPKSPFEFRCMAPSVVVPGQLARATFEACFSDDWEWVTDLGTGGRFHGPMAWGLDCRQRAGCKEVRGISIKSAIYYHGLSLAQHERAAATAAVATAATTAVAASTAASAADNSDHAGHDGADDNSKPTSESVFPTISPEARAFVENGPSGATAVLAVDASRQSPKLLIESEDVFKSAQRCSEDAQTLERGNGLRDKTDIDASVQSIAMSSGGEMAVAMETAMASAAALSHSDHIDLHSCQPNGRQDSERQQMITECDIAVKQRLPAGEADFLSTAATASEAANAEALSTIETFCSQGERFTLADEVREDVVEATKLIPSILDAEREIAAPENCSTKVKISEKPSNELASKKSLDASATQDIQAVITSEASQLLFETASDREDRAGSCLNTGPCGENFRYAVDDCAVLAPMVASRKEATESGTVDLAEHSLIPTVRTQDLSACVVKAARHKHSNSDIAAGSMADFSSGDLWIIDKNRNRLAMTCEAQTRAGGCEPTSKRTGTTKPVRRIQSQANTRKSEKSEGFAGDRGSKISGVATGLAGWVQDGAGTRLSGCSHTNTLDYIPIPPASGVISERAFVAEIAAAETAAESSFASGNSKPRSLGARAPQGTGMSPSQKRGLCDDDGGYEQGADFRSVKQPRVDNGLSSAGRWSDDSDDPVKPRSMKKGVAVPQEVLREGNGPIKDKTRKEIMERNERIQGFVSQVFLTRGTWGFISMVGSNETVFFHHNA